MGVIELRTLRTAARTRGVLLRPRLPVLLPGGRTGRADPRRGRLDPGPGVGAADGALPVGAALAEFRAAAEVQAARAAAPTGLAGRISGAGPSRPACRVLCGRGRRRLELRARGDAAGVLRRLRPGGSRVLAEVAAASGIAIDACLAAAVDSGRDQRLWATANGLRTARRPQAPGDPPSRAVPPGRSGPRRAGPGPARLKDGL